MRCSSDAFKRKIQGLRRDAGHTQKEVAALIGVTEVCYQQYEYGKRIPDACIASKIAKLFNTTVEELWGGCPAAGGEGISEA